MEIKEIIRFKQISTSIAVILLIIFTCVARSSASDPAEKGADRLEDRVDQIREIDKEDRKITENVRESITNNKENEAD